MPGTENMDAAKKEKIVSIIQEIKLKINFKIEAKKKEFLYIH